MLNQDYIKERILKNCRYKDSHAATDDHLGYGLLYYTFTYILKAKVAVCLGSGSGFVPKLMRQAQLDLGLTDSRTILVDADLGSAGWGSPDYFSGETDFTKNFDVVIIKKTTKDALEDFKGIPIDYLHIDADHSYEGAVHDLREYLKLVNKKSIITLHDSAPDMSIWHTKQTGVYRAMCEIQKEGLIEFTNLDFLSYGLGIAKVI